jgi:hypothetical protein
MARAGSTDDVRRVVRANVDECGAVESDTDSALPWASASRRPGEEREDAPTAKCARRAGEVLLAPAIRACPMSVDVARESGGPAPSSRSGTDADLPREKRIPGGNHLMRYELPNSG